MNKYKILNDFKSIKLLNKNYENLKGNIIFKKWCSDNKIAKKGGGLINDFWKWILDIKRPNYFYETDIIPSRDHVETYITITQQKIIVFHPYQIDKSELLKWCNDRNLSCIIKDRKFSWYNPNSTLLVEIRRK
jgi:hypothetical protein